MYYAFLVSGDYPILGRAEIDSLFASKCELSSERLYIYKIKNFETGNAKRLALTKEVTKVFRICSIEEIENSFKEFIKNIDKSKFYCIRVKNFINKKETTNLEKYLGAILWRDGFKISVSKPDKILKIYICKNFIVIGELVYSIREKFSNRHPRKRPYFKPGVMIPKLCRAIVNITLKDGIFLDPMCGTGGLLIEAGLIGLKFVGIELFKDVALGCVKNLKYFGLKTDVLCGDSRNLPFKDESIDGIATDYPYYISSKSCTNSEDLHKRTIEEFLRVLKPKSKAVIVTNIDAECYLKDFKLIDVHRLRVHGSLTRRIYVCLKP